MNSNNICNNNFTLVDALSVTGNLSTDNNENKNESESKNEEENDQKISVKDFMLSVIKCISDYLGNDLFMIYNAKYYGKKISTCIIQFGEYLSTERENQSDNLLLCKELLKQLTN